MKLFFHPSFLLVMKKGRLIGVQGYERRFFELDPLYIERLLFWSDDQNTVANLTKIDEELLEAGLLQKTPALPYWHGDQLSHFVHYATRNAPQNTLRLSRKQVMESTINFALSRPPVPKRYVPNHLGEIPLPSPDLSLTDKISLKQSWQKRMTTRQFLNETTTLQVLSDLLYIGFGPFHGEEWPELIDNGFIQKGKRRAAPSSTGLQGCEGYLIAMNVVGLKPGVYKYDDEAHALLTLHHNVTWEKLISCVISQYWIEGAAFAIFTIIDMQRAWIKSQDSRTYLLGYLETGHIAQNLQLAATAYDMGTWITGNFNDEELCQLLSLEGRDDMIPSFVIAIGKAKNTPVPKGFEDNQS